LIVFNLLSEFRGWFFSRLCFPILIFGGFFLFLTMVPWIGNWFWLCSSDRMVFTSALFVAFLIFFLIIYGLFNAFLRLEIRLKIIKIYFVFASFGFYSILHPPYLLLLCFTITLDFWISQCLETRRWLLYVSLASNLSLLGFFKYANFLEASLFSLLGLEYTPGSGLLPEILLPLGISFFTFQSMSYTIDVSRGVLKPVSSWWDYAFYLSFFPQLVAGPIVKAKDFLPQIRSPIPWSEIPLFASLAWVGLGVLKKSVLADRLAFAVDPVFSHPDLFSSEAALLAVLSYGLQIFLDFSGYSDIAIGMALFLGFRLPLNFHLPYLASGFSDFWRRWHISLSSWLRDYLYIGLGGNRISAWITYRNLFLVMLLGGIWHGANWNFLIWGGLHGIFLALERGIANQAFRFVPVLASFSIVRCLYRVFVVGVVFLLWIFFRAEDTSTALRILEKCLNWETGINPAYTTLRDAGIVICIVILGHILGRMGFHPRFWESVKIRPILHGLGFALGILILVFLSVPGKPFIYFVF